MRKLLLTLALGMCSAAFGQTVIKLTHVVRNDTPKGQAFLKFKEILENESNGAFKVEIYPESQLYNDEDVVSALQVNQVQMAAPAIGKVESLNSAFSVFNLPFLFRDIKDVECFEQSEDGKSLLNSLEGKGIIGLGYLNNGMKQLTSNRRIVTPSDARGMKIRILPSKILSAQYEAINAIPIERPFSQVYSLLKVKALDGQESPWSNIYTQQFYKAQPYITVSNHGVLNYAVLISRSFWDSLTDVQKNQIKHAVSEAIAFGNTEAAKYDRLNRELVAASGESEIIELSKSEREEWVKVMRKIWKQFEGQIGSNIIHSAEFCNK